MQDAFAIFMNCLIRRRRPERNSIITTLDVTASCLALKKWPGSWMKEWFYVKNDLNQREDVRGVIQRPIWSRFGIRRPSIALGNEVHACQIAFNTICTYIGTRDLVLEHISYKVWPLANEWEMPKEATAGSSQSGLVYLKYTFRFRSQFDEPNDDWCNTPGVTVTKT